MVWMCNVFVHLLFLTSAMTLYRHWTTCTLFFSSWNIKNYFSSAALLRGYPLHPPSQVIRVWKKESLLLDTHWEIVYTLKQNLFSCGESFFWAWCDCQCVDSLKLSLNILVSSQYCKHWYPMPTCGITNRVALCVCCWKIFASKGGLM